MNRALLAVWFLLFAACGTVPAADDSPDELQAFREFLTAYRKEKGIPALSVAVVRGGEIIVLESIGWQDHDGEEPVTPRTTYLVASISKTFTAATLLAMAADGHIDLDDDFTTLSDWQQRCEALKASGSIFGGGGALDDGTVTEELRCDVPITLRQVLQHRVQGEPGSAFSYNPVVFGRLSNWVEENTDRSFREWMYRYVIEPGGLRTIAAGWRDPRGGAALTHLAPPFRHDPKDDDGPVPSPVPNPELNGSSGIIASVVDLADYSRALDEHRILSPELLEAMWTPTVEADGRPAAYAYGWWVQEWQGERLVWHGGWWPDAYAGLLLKVPDADLTLIALGNTDGLRWGNPLDAAEVEKSPVARRFLEIFVAD